MSRKRLLLIAAGIAVSFLILVVGILYLAAKEIATPTQAKLMVMELLGLYIGFGVLIAIYRLMRHLD